MKSRETKIEIPSEHRLYVPPIISRTPVFGMFYVDKRNKKTLKLLQQMTLDQIEVMKEESVSGHKMCSKFLRKLQKALEENENTSKPNQM